VQNLVDPPDLGRGAPAATVPPMSGLRERWSDRPVTVVLLAGAAAAVAALAGLTLLVRHDPAAGWERDVVEAAVDLPGVVGGPLWLVMQLGRRSLVPLVALVVFLATRRPRPVVGLVVAGMVTGFGIDVWKDWSGRARPTGVPTREDLHGFGFPSGHTATAFALAVIVAALVPERAAPWRRAVPFVVAALVAAGRLNAGVHYPLDVVGGALWGLAVGAVTVAALRTVGEQG
jgi:membrane-associated phospholipid phosphatase